MLAHDIMKAGAMVIQIIYFFAMLQLGKMVSDMKVYKANLLQNFSR